MEIVERDRGRKVELLESKGAREQLHVCVIQTGQHRGAVSIHDHRLRAAEPLHITVGSDPQNLVAAHGHGFLNVGATTRIHFAVYDDQIDRPVRIVALRADDEPGDERGADDHDHQNCGQARRHFEDSSRFARGLAPA